MKSQFTLGVLSRECSLSLRKIAAILLLPLCWVGCDNVNVKPAHEDRVVTEDRSSMKSDSEYGTTIVDKMDREITIVGVPKRIVSLSPSTTELLFALGLGDSIVGVTEHCNYPEEAKAIAKVGSGTLEGISREAILNAKPDLILCKWDNHRPLVETFERVNIPIVGLGPENVDQLFEEALLIGKVARCEAQATSLIESMRARLEKLKKAAHSIAPSQRKKVFYEVWDTPLMTAGPQSFIGELLVLGNMENIFHDTVNRYPRVSSESVVERNPDVILAPTTHGEKVRFETLANRAGWENVAAIKNRQVFLIDGDQVSRCGPRLLDALESMIQQVYPEALAQRE